MNYPSYILHFTSYIFFCFLSLPSFAQQHYYNLRHFSFQTEDFTDTIPLEWTHQKAFVQVMVNGKSLRMLLDTGASMSTLYTQFADRQDTAFQRALLVKGNITMHDALGTQAKVQVVESEHFAIGSLQVVHYPMLVMPRPTSMAQCDGVLGFDLINKGLLVKIDTDRHHLIISDQQSALEDEDGYRIRYKLQRFVPYLKLKPFTKMKELMAFDTGCSYLCLLNHDIFTEYESRNPHEVAPQVEATQTEHIIVGVNGQRSMVNSQLKLYALQWKGLSLHGIEALTTQGRSRLGSPILDYGSIIINGRHRTITFQPYMRMQ